MPQIVFWPFMAATMVEDGFSVKVSPGRRHGSAQLTQA
jgi:hypothetical protein